MTEAKIKVDAGVCRFITTIAGTCDDGMTVKLTIESGCPSVKKLAAVLKEMSVFDAVAAPLTENPLFVECSKYIGHAACVVPAALVKVCEVAGDLGLKKDVSFQFIS